MGWIKAVKRGHSASGPETITNRVATCSLDTSVTLLKCGSDGTITLPEASAERVGTRKVFIALDTNQYTITPSKTVDDSGSRNAVISGAGGVAQFIWTSTGWALFGDSDVAVADS